MPNFFNNKFVACVDYFIFRHKIVFLIVFIYEEYFEREFYQLQRTRNRCSISDFVTVINGTALAVNTTSYSEDTLSTGNEENEIIETITDYLDLVDQLFVNESLDEGKINVSFNNN